MMDDAIRIMFLVLSGLALVLISVWYVYFCFQEITGTGRVVIDPLTVVTDDTGAVISDAIGVLAKEGAVEEVVWPYKAGEFAAKPPATVNTATRWLIAEAKSLKGLDAIKPSVEQRVSSDRLLGRRTGGMGVRYFTNGTVAGQDARAGERNQ